ncbi:hypothetical protein CE457_03130 [Vreelandella boliviensis LC1]|uniref:Uncharacterized protein n=1 Tax=Vreelandella boliviensis LC1 TaxID=1072583 RepID=A0ABX4GCA6_9GAMM|nr:hypothetical protein CE457_03130 [Halomonas boliviensis LC1]
MRFINKIYCGLALSTLGLISACSNNVPGCSDSQVTDLVLEITNDELTKVWGQEDANATHLSLNAIRTTDENEKTGALNCAAELSFNQATKFPVTYTVEVTDDEQIYVTVFGL